MHDIPPRPLPAFLRDLAVARPSVRILAMSILTGQSHELSLNELDILRRVPSSQWVAVNQIIRDAGPSSGLILEALVSKGLLIANGMVSSAEESLETIGWAPSAALLHFTERTQDLDLSGVLPCSSHDLPKLRLRLLSSLERLVDRWGPPPTAFPTRADAKDVVDLSLASSGCRLSELLTKRQTARVFSDRPISLRETSALLGDVFGCRATWDMGRGVVALKKTSPSGGALHPTEVYLLSLNIADLRAGIYHYATGTHSLELLEVLSTSEARVRAFQWLAGQPQASSAAALFVMTARFGRAFWKYRNMAAAYRVILMDIGHLSQTFYLLCTDMGLGAFFSATVNGKAIDDALGLGGVREGAIGICGCGFPGYTAEPEATWLPYRPRGLAWPEHSA